MSFQKSTSKVSLGLVVLGSGLPVTAQAATLPVEVPALNQDILNTIDTVSDDSVLEIESDSDIPVLSTDPESSVEPGFSHKTSQIGNDATLPISSESTSEAISYADLESNIVVDPEIDTESIFSITEQITTIQNSSQDVPNLLNEQVESSVVESEPSAFQESEDILVAQILPDTTLGDETSVVTSDVLIDGELADQIDGGAVRGTNLFHSFEEFNVDTGQRVYFENSSGINNILTRVTGENISNIDGVLGVNGPANFFIVNPNGVIFGPNAALDVRGAFSVSTTESIPFSDGSEFSAANISQTPMLSVSVPLGVQSGNNSIETSRTDINGDILLQEGSEIIWPSDNTLTFLASQDIRLSNNSKIKSTNGGNINFITESLELISGSQITANTSNLEDSGKISIVANEHITVSGNSSYIESSVNSNASGNSGGVEIITDSLSVIDGGAIITNTLGSGDSGLLHITSRDNINIAGQGSILTSRVRTDAIGNSGGIEIITKDLDVTDGAIIIASTFGSGSSGQLSIDAQSGTVRVARGSGIGNEVRNNISVGQNQRSSGDLIIMAGSLIVEDNSVINANTLGNGSSGQLKINANELIRVSGSNSRISNGVSTDAIGNSGGIEIITNSLDVLDGAGIIGSTEGIGNPGQINITADGDVIVKGNDSDFSIIANRINETGIGVGMGININADNLLVTDNAEIFSTIFNRGSAGDININVDGNIEVRGENSIIASGVATNGIGDSGNINIQSNTLSLSGGADITTNTQGIGNSGFLSINSREYIELDGTIIATDGGFTSITSNVTESAIGNSGGVRIETTTLNIFGKADIDASTEGRGNSGLLEIDVAENIRLDGNLSGLVSGVGRSGLGNSLGIDISTNNLNLVNGAAITSTTSGMGNAGLIKIDTDGGTLELDGASRITSRVRNQVSLPTGTTRSSNGIEIISDSLLLSNGSTISTTTEGNGNSGFISLHVPNIIAINGTDSFIESRVNTNAFGSSNGILIKTDSLNLNQGSVTTATLGQGNGGSIELNANTVELFGGSLTSETSGQGIAGDISIQPYTDQNLSVTFNNNAQISASTQSSEPGASISLNAPEMILVSGNGRLIAESQGEASGVAGTLTITADSVTLDNSIELSTRAESPAGGGDIKFIVNDTLLLRRGSVINAEATNATVGTAGNIDIDAGFVIAVPNENSDVIANANGGNGGRIDITTNQIFGFEEQSEFRFTTSELRDNASSDLSASSQSGQQGIIAISTLAPDPNQGLTELPLISPAPPIQQGCSAASIGNSSFTVTGRGGLPPGPAGSINTDRPLADLGPEALPPDSFTNVLLDESTPTPSTQILEAQGWVTDSDGEVFFTAQSLDTSFEESRQPSIQCSGNALTNL